MNAGNLEMLKLLQEWGGVAGVSCVAVLQSLSISLASACPALGFMV